MPNLSLKIIKKIYIIKKNIIKSIRKSNFNTDKIIRNKRTQFETEEEDYYELIRISNAFDDNFIGYESKRKNTLN